MSSQRPLRAEERSVPGLGDLLHLVSGQTLLGSVRERHAQNLGSPGHWAAHIGPGIGAPAQLGKHDTGLHRQAVNVSADSTGFSSASGPDWAAVSSSSEDGKRPAQEIDPLGQAVYPTDGASSHEAANLRHMHVYSDKRSSKEQPADVLDLYVTSDTGDHLIATAVRQRAVAAASQDPGTSSMNPGSKGLPAANADCSSAETPASTIRIYAADDEGGQMLCRVDKKGHIHPAKQLRSGVQHQILPQPRHLCAACTLSSTQVGCSGQAQKTCAPEQPQTDLCCK